MRLGKEKVGSREEDWGEEKEAEEGRKKVGRGEENWGEERKAEEGRTGEKRRLGRRGGGR